MPNTDNIEIAKNAGFCFGVKRAVNTAKELKKQNPDKDIFILGELIHNSQVIEELDSCGIKTLYELPEKGSGICIIRTHGETPAVIEQIKKAGFTPYDLTCPHVKKVQEKAIELVKEGYYLVIAGQKEHPEVIAIKANAQIYGNNIVVASNVEELKQKEADLKISRKIGVVVQTTQMNRTLNSIIEYLITIGKEIHIANTICPSTHKRQSESAELAQKTDLMIIAGSKKSANTTHLAKIATQYTKAIHIETADELSQYKELINSSSKIGVTAGASTPQNVIDEVIDKLKIK